MYDLQSESPDHSHDCDCGDDCHHPSIHAQQQKIRIEVVRGDAALADEQFYADMFRLYATTVEKMWGSQYLTHDFFSLLAQVGR